MAAPIRTTPQQFFTNYMQSMRERRAATAAASTGAVQAPAEVLEAWRTCAAAVESFTTASQLCVEPRVAGQAVRVNPVVSLESLSGQLHDEQLDAMIREARIPAEFAVTARDMCVNLIARHIGGNAAAWANHGQTLEVGIPSEGVVRQSLESLMTPQAMAELRGNVSVEAFGIDINTTVPDLQKALTISLMAFHQGIVPRLLPLRPTASPAVRYVVDYTEVYDNDDTTTAPVPAIELYMDPTLVANELKAIVPLAAQDTGGDYLISDGVIKPAVEANILTLSINPAAAGYERINRTDLVADDVKLATILVTVTLDGGAGADTVEDFSFTIPMDKARFARTNNTEDASDRVCMFTHAALLRGDALMSNGSASTIFKATAPGTFPASGEGAKVVMNFTGRINLKTGVLFGQCGVAISGYSPSGASLTFDYSGLSATCKAYTVDARFDEANMRKSSITARAMRRVMEYELAHGRNYFIDLAHNQADDETTVAALANIIKIGQDTVNLDIIVSALQRIRTMVNAQTTDAVNLVYTVGQYFAAGRRVRPYVYTGKIDLSSVTTIRTSDRTGDVKQYVKSALNGITAKMQFNTKYRQQLAAGTPVHYSAFTDEKTLAAILSMPHIHNHLDKAQPQQAANGADYTLVLDNGTVIDIITVPFAKFEHYLVMIPTLVGAPESELNFGHLWDFGTMVGAYQATDGRQSGRRLFANSRQMPIPTCPVGAIIEIDGIDAASYLPTEAAVTL